MDFIQLITGASSRKNLGEAKPMDGHNLPPDRDGVYVTKNLGKAIALPATALLFITQLE